jgi:serine O-acetyltransferase
MEQRETEVPASQPLRNEIPEIVDELVRSCCHEDSFDHLGREQISSRESIMGIIQRATRILYPGYFVAAHLDAINLEHYFDEEVTAFYEVLSERITLAIPHDCLHNGQRCTQCKEHGRQTAICFLRKMPKLRAILAKDVRAAFDGDPAAKSYDEIIFSYPGLFAITVYRIAHLLHEQGVPLIPRMMTEHAHSMTGIDIHPGAKIGESFFIDHGTGIVVGETTEIGDRVRLYQGVTLGALSVPKDTVERLRYKKRHPTIKDEVIIYAGATILGGNTVIGARSVIGGNVWITDSVPPDTRVFLKRPELVFEENRTEGTLRKKKERVEAEHD